MADFHGVTNFKFLTYFPESSFSLSAGLRCETNINDCTGDPCGISSTCVDGVNSYSCECGAGYTGPNCRTNIDECTGVNCNNGRYV